MADTCKPVTNFFFFYLGFYKYFNTSDQVGRAHWSRPRVWDPGRSKRQNLLQKKTLLKMKNKYVKKWELTSFFFT